MYTLSQTAAAVEQRNSRQQRAERLAAQEKADTESARQIAQMKAEIQAALAASQAKK